jgi:hypothetical protein
MSKSSDWIARSGIGGDEPGPDSEAKDSLDEEDEHRAGRHVIIIGIIEGCEGADL